MDKNTNTYRVPESNLSTLQARIEKLVRRCKRNSIEAPSINILGHEDVPYRTDKTTSFAGFTDQGVQKVRRYFTVELISNGRPKINGYEFAAVISPVLDDQGKLIGNVLRGVPGFEGVVPDRFRTATNACDHCNTNRYRLETFVIANADGFKQVGRNCLATYLGMADPSAYAEWAQILIDASDLCGMSEDDYDGNGDSHVTRLYVLDVLQTSASCIRQYGWLSRKSAQEFDKQSTSDRVRNWIMGTPKSREAFEHKLDATDADVQLAANALEYIQGLTTATNDYEQNLNLLGRAESITAKNLGILVSAISAYSRAKEFEIRRNKRIESDKDSKHVGQVGERIVFEGVTLLYTQQFEGDFGVSTLYKMKTTDGNLIIWFGSGSNPFNIEQGDVIPEFKGTVKAHETREGVLQTKLSRCQYTPRKMSKDEKKGVAKLKRILKTIEYCQENSYAHQVMGELIRDIQDGKYAEVAQ